MDSSATRRAHLRATLSLTLAIAAGIVATPTYAGRAVLPHVQEGTRFDQFIIKYKAGSSLRKQTAAMNHGLQLAANRTKFGNAGAFGLSHSRGMALGMDVIRASRKLDRAETISLLQQIAADPAVQFVQVDSPLTVLMTPNDPYYSQQWHYFETTGGLNLPGAWDLSTGSGTVVAVIDTGITAHPDLDANVVAGYDFITDSVSAGDGGARDANPRDEGTFEPATGGGGTYCPPSGCVFPVGNSVWHGTHVAGTIAAVTNNASGVAGVAHGAKIQPLRAFGKGGRGATSDVIDAIVWAAGGTVSGVAANPTPADVINMSFGYSTPGCGSAFQTAIDFAAGRGTVLVAAGGNSNAPASTLTPANCNHVVAVAATDRQGNRASYSNHGPAIDVSAPGGETLTPANGVLSTYNLSLSIPTTPSYEVMEGTSMAAPHVSGVVALMQTRNRRSPDAVEALLKSTARPLPGVCTEGCGAGIVHAAAAVAAATPIRNVKSDVNMDGRSDILWHSITQHQMTWWLQNGPAQLGTGSTSVPAEYRVGAHGDFNGDGYEDVIYHDDDKTVLLLWQAKATGGYEILPVGPYPTDKRWQIEGAGDIDGDGRDDLFWYNPSLPRLDWWLMHGNVHFDTGSKSLSSGYVVAGIGDFNGDGTADVLWHDNARTRIYLWLADATDFTVSTAIAYPTDTNWNIVGTGDFNADGKDDIFWHNPSIPQAAWWLMNGATRLQAPSKSLSTGYEVAATGDYNGDGRTDVFWHDVARTRTYIWQNDGVGSFSVLPGPAYPSADMDAIGQ